MPRPATGSVIYNPKAETFALRFRALGRRQYLTLGTKEDGWDQEKAAMRLRHTLADVERGIWRPPEPEPVPDRVKLGLKTFDGLARQWWTLNGPKFAARTQEDYLWRLNKHLLPAFGAHPLDRIDYDMVEGYIADRLAEKRPLSPRAINMIVTLGATIFESAIERYPDDLKRNPFKGKNRRARERHPQRAILDSANAIRALLDATAAMDAGPRNRHIHRKAIVTTLLFAGLRIGELCHLRWRSVDLAGGWLHVEDSKTDAGVRRVKIRGALRDVLVSIKPADANPDGYVFPTDTGKPMNPSNIRNRILRPAEKRASAKLVDRGLAPLPHLTPHSCRRTFASVLYALGEDPGVVMDEMGHTNPNLALAVYRQSMRRDDAEKNRLKALVDGSQWAVSGSNGDQGHEPTMVDSHSESQETAV